jgi:hypothetical protein
MSFISCHCTPFRHFFHIIRISEPLQIGLELEILPKNRKFSGAIMMAQEEEIPPEVSGFRLRPRSEVWGRVVLTPYAVPSF